MVKVPNLWEYLFLTCVAVGLAFLDHWTSKFSKWYSWVGTQRNAVPALYPQRYRF